MYSTNEKSLRNRNQVSAACLFFGEFWQSFYPIDIKGITVQSGQTLWCEGLHKRYQLQTSTTNEQIIKTTSHVLRCFLQIGHTSQHQGKIQKKGIPCLCYKAFSKLFQWALRSLILNTQTQAAHMNKPTTIPGQAACREVHGRRVFVHTS